MGHRAKQGKGRSSTIRKCWHPALPVGLCRKRMGKLLKRRSSWRWMAPAMLLCLVLPGVAATETRIDDLSPGQMQSGTLLMRMQSGYRIATRLNTDIKLEVSGLVARVSVRQKFLNDGSEWVEGVYVFPLPDDAAVNRLRPSAFAFSYSFFACSFSRISPSIKEQAKKEYETAKAEGRKASLVEQPNRILYDRVQAPRE